VFGRVSTWNPGARASRRASVVLGSSLLVICGFAAVANYRLSAAVVSAHQAVTASDLAQTARYYSVLEKDQIDSYLLTHDPVLRDDYETVSLNLDGILGQLVGQVPTHSAEARELTRLIGTQTQYETVARNMFQELLAGQVGTAQAMTRTSLDPYNQNVQQALGTIEEAHLTSANAALATATHEGKLQRAGTPIVLVVGLMILVLLFLVGRGHRRAIERQALHDALTGLPNRLLFSDRAMTALAAARRSGAEPVVMVLDLDQFKEVNDTLGHHVGDDLLIEVSRRLAKVLRPGDTIARFGGDEFAVLLGDGGRDAGGLVAERISQALEEPFELDNVTLGIEVSIGVTTQRESPDNQDLHMVVQDLLRQADSAMYTAKAQHTGYAHYAAGSDESSPHRLALLGELRQAMDRDELVLHFQPKVAADTAELVGVEALVRWQHPVRGLLPPADFIGLAESTSLIKRLTTVVLEKALDFTHGWMVHGHRIPVAVNVSARSLLDPTFPAAVATQLANAGVPPQLLCLELTESTIMIDPDGALAVLRKLHDMGIRLAVDDFGTGYSSMAYLKILPVDELKVDRTFVGDMTRNDSNTVLVQSAVDLGHNLGLSVVAEGVEDDVTLVALRSLGTDVVQGYYTGRPMPADAISEWIRDHSLDVAAAQPS
jgi:diguanylate cyclase (GGDEF)-like protein